MKKQGNIKAQRQRHKINNEGVARLDKYYLTVDGNPTCRPYAYCTHYQAYLTKNQSILHKCVKRKCKNYNFLEENKEE